MLRTNEQLNGVQCEIRGIPDFLIYGDGGYVIRDSKISRRINEKDHPEIIYQLQSYGWIYDRTFGQPPESLQVHSGSNEIIDIPYDGGLVALEEQLARFAS
jgi:hypothetical protein